MHKITNPNGHSTFIDGQISAGQQNKLMQPKAIARS
jgi:hypothetical protein